MNLYLVQRDDSIGRDRVASMSADAAWSLMLDLPGGTVEAHRLLAPVYGHIREDVRDSECRWHVRSELMEMPFGDAMEMIAKAGAQ